MSEGLYDCDDGEPCAWYANDKITARKTWTCEECKHPIVPGEKYHRIRYMYEATVSGHTICVCCEAARCKVAEKAGGFGQACIQYGYLWEVVEYGIKEGWLTADDIDRPFMEEHEQASSPAI